ncbi:hypothetical protein [Agrobacterium radiobacter]|uniref:hypothetical protein n=1 Tax=Agrobacterium radiobacter TaxID=362 RepID=UPI000761A638|nr:MULTISPECIES: hypothetical protein [Agrobacterium tumefaciens complex]KAB0459777.1 hypothetical protein F7R04_12770 [Agrobacterium tumefaciens]KWT77088.1 hypothetical protein ASH09_12165 [Agrobacterium radiobacter]NIB11117.1 hypothetical protein [Agrobacterium radiobacter]OOO38259.1 hypothetical protein BS628_08890 [Agrobacterium radiobacter]
MEAVDIGGLVLSAIGIGLSIWALVMADGAKKAVKKVVEKNNDLASRDDARDLLNTLSSARDASLARRSSASRIATAGRNLNGDIHTLRVAQDALATVTLGTNEALVEDLRVAASELERALSTVESGSHEGWAAALAVIQGVTPKVDVLQRGLVTKALTT